MKNIFLFISFIGLISCSEPPIKTYYPDGNINMIGDSTNGTLTVHWKNGNKAISTDYSEGLKHGTKQVWFEGGELQTQMFFIKGIPNGDIKSWYKNGELSSRAYYRNGKLDGEFVSMDSLGRNVGVQNFLNGKLHGIYRVQNPETKDLYEYIEYENGKKHGKYLKNFLNGNSEIEMYYYHDSKDSISKEWFETGEIRRIRNFSDDTLEGLFQVFYKNGTIWRESIYENGNATFEKQFHENGKLKSECNYNNGERHGSFTYLDSTGNILVKETYNYGEVIN